MLKKYQNSSSSKKTDSGSTSCDEMYGRKIAEVEAAVARSVAEEKARDIRWKVRARIAKIFLRVVNFACSLIVISLVSTSFVVFNATKHLPVRNDLSPWSDRTPLWPQILVLSIASFSLALAVLSLVITCLQGHRKGERIGRLHELFCLIYLLFNLILWSISIGILRSNQEQRDIWNWSCAENTRRILFEAHIPYSLVCRFLDWTLICTILQVIIEILAISIHLVMVCKFWATHRLQRALCLQDRFRRNVYMMEVLSRPDIVPVPI